MLLQQQPLVMQQQQHVFVVSTRGCLMCSSSTAVPCLVVAGGLVTCTTCHNAALATWPDTCSCRLCSSSRRQLRRQTFNDELFALANALEQQ